MRAGLNLQKELSVRSKWDNALASVVTWWCPVLWVGKWTELSAMALSAGLSCSLQLPSTAFQHTWAAARQDLSPSPAALVQSCLSRYAYFFSYYSLVLICEPPFLLILSPNTPLRKRSECLGAKSVNNHEMCKTISLLLAFFLLDKFLKDVWLACWPSYAGRNHSEI